MATIKKCRHDRAEWSQCNCQWYWDHRVDGRRVYTPISGPEVVLEGGVGTFRHDAAAWLAQYDDARAGTRSAYRAYVRRLNKIFGDWPTAAIDGPTLDSFSTDAQGHYSSGSAVLVFNVLIRIIQHAGLTVPKHVAPKNKKPPPRPPMTMTEIRRVIDAMPVRTRGMAEFAVLTGLRQGELLGLMPEDVDDDAVVVRRQRNGARVWPPKTNNGYRRVYIGRRAKKLLDEGSSPYIFPFSTSTSSLDLRLAFERCALYQPGMGWHTLRHFNATLRERSGEGLRGAQAAMGHQNLSQTLGYGWGESSASAATDLEDYFHE